MTASFNYSRPDPALVAAYAGVSAATAHEAQGRTGALASAVKPIARGMRVLGPAFTCECPPGDNLTLHAALKLARPGDVIVCAAAGYAEQGLFGDVMSSCAKGAGIAGLVTDGGVRDGATIAQIGFPVFAKAVSIIGTVKENLGAIARPVVVGGVVVHPGDLVIGDDDGVVVVPRADAHAVLAASREREAKEERFRQALLAGQTTWDMLDLNALLRRKGVDFTL